MFNKQYLVDEKKLLVNGIELFFETKHYYEKSGICHNTTHTLERSSYLKLLELLGIKEIEINQKEHLFKIFQFPPLYFDDLLSTLKQN